MTNATWKKKPASANYDDPNNWSGGVVPDGTAIFGVSSKHALDLTGSNTINAWVFTAQAAHYSFLQPTGFELRFEGAGISIKGGSATIDDPGIVTFANSAVAGKAHFIIEEESGLNFEDQSRASTAHIHVKQEGQANFDGSSSAGQAQIVVDDTGLLQFFSTSTAGAAVITASGTVELTASGSLGSANLTIASTGQVFFNDSSTAEKAHIADNGLLDLSDNSTAGSAVITVANGAALDFSGNSTGGHARLIDKVGGSVDFSNTVGSVDGITVGSIQAGGNLFLGGHDLQIVSNRSTTFTGTISDGGIVNDTGGSLTKLGMGTLTLAHLHNTYTGGTTIEDGKLNVAAVEAAGTGDIHFATDDVPGATLEIQKGALSSSHEFGNIIDNFAHGFIIDLAGLAFTKRAHVTVTDLGGGLFNLDVKSGHITDTLTLLDPEIGNFKLSNDGHGGTKITLKPATPERPDAQVSGNDVSIDAHHGAQVFHDFL